MVKVQQIDSSNRTWVLKGFTKRGGSQWVQAHHEGQLLMTREEAEAAVARLPIVAQIVAA